MKNDMRIMFYRGEFCIRLKLQWYNVIVRLMFNNGCVRDIHDYHQNELKKIFIVMLRKYFDN